MLLSFGEELPRLGASFAVGEAEGGIPTTILVFLKLLFGFLQHFGVSLMIVGVEGLHLTIPGIFKGASSSFTTCIVLYSC